MGSTHAGVEEKGGGEGATEGVEADEGGPKEGIWVEHLVEQFAGVGLDGKVEVGEGAEELGEDEA